MACVWLPPFAVCVLLLCAALWPLRHPPSPVPVPATEALETYCALNPLSAAPRATLVHMVVDGHARFNPNHYLLEVVVPAVALAAVCPNPTPAPPYHCLVNAQIYGPVPPYPNFGTQASALALAFLRPRCRSLAFAAVTHNLSSSSVSSVAALTPTLDFDARCLPSSPCLGLHLQEFRPAHAVPPVNASLRAFALAQLSLALREQFRLEPRPGPPRLLLYSREDARNGRALRNAFALAEELRRLLPRFTVHLVRDLQSMSVRERFEAFGRASVVLAPHGAWTPNTLLMPPGSLVLAVEKWAEERRGRWGAIADCPSFEEWDAAYRRPGVRVLLVSSSASVRTPGERVVRCGVRHHGAGGGGDVSLDLASLGLLVAELESAFPP